MLLKTKGIILRAIKYSETSIITDIYTEKKGLRSYIVSGVRTKNARIKAGLLQLMSIVDLVVYHRDDKDLTRIKEIKSAYVYQSVPFDIVKGALGLFLTEVAQKTIKEQEENLPLFEFLVSYFQFLDQTKNSVSNLHLLFLVELSTFLGFMPNYVEGKTNFFDLKEGTFVNWEPNHLHYLDKELSQKLLELMTISKEEIHTISLNKTQRKTLLTKLLDFYTYHIENLSPIQAHLVLEEVLG